MRDILLYKLPSGICAVELLFVSSLNHLFISVPVCFCLAGRRTDTPPQIRACSVAVLLAPCASLSSCLTHHSLTAQQVPTCHTQAHTHTGTHTRKVTSPLNSIIKFMKGKERKQWEAQRHITHFRPLPCSSTQSLSRGKPSEHRGKRSDTS